MLSPFTLDTKVIDFANEVGTQMVLGYLVGISLSYTFFWQVFQSEFAS